jgi:hypothetical protein
MDRVNSRGGPRHAPNSDKEVIENVEGRMRCENEMRQNEQNRNAINTLKRKRKHEETQ